LREALWAVDESKTGCYEIRAPEIRMRMEARLVAGALVALVAVSIGCSDESNGPEQPGSGAPNATGGASGAGGTSGAAAGGASNGGSGLAGDAGSGAAAGVSSSGGGSSSSGGGGDAVGGSNAGDGGNAGDPSGGSVGMPPDGGTPSGELTVFYLDVGGSVMATDVENPMARTIVEDAGQGPDGLAIDMDRGHIYWTGMGNPSADDGFIMRSNLDGSNIITVVEPGGTYTPKQLRIDHENGKLYWSDREGMRVMRSNLDGSMIETLVTTGTTAEDRRDNSNWCVGIAIDVEGGFFYWSQKGPDNGMVGSLRRAHIAMPQGQNSTNRSDIEVLFSGLPEPIDIDLDLENDLIYWTDRGDDTINRAPIGIPEGATAANRTDREVLIEGVREAIGVTLDLASGKLFFTGGTGGRVGMANLDGSGVQDLLTGSAGLTGIVVVELPR
jgi:hypothetical protein